MYFENFINPLNEMYQRGGVALINKRPTPVKVLKSSGGHVPNGFDEGLWRRVKRTSYCIWSKVYRECYKIWFEEYCAASVGYLEKAEKMGTICFFLIEFSKDESVLLVPLSVIQLYVRMSQQPKGKKSITRAEFDTYCTL